MCDPVVCFIKVSPYKGVTSRNMYPGTTGVLRNCGPDSSGCTLLQDSVPCVWHVYSTDFVLRCTSSLSLLIFSDMQHLCCPWPLPKRHRSSCDSSDTSIPPCRRTSCDPENAPSSRNHCRITDPHIPHPAHRTPHNAHAHRQPPTANRRRGRALHGSAYSRAATRTVVSQSSAGILPHNRQHPPSRTLVATP